MGEAVRVLAVQADRREEGEDFLPPLLLVRVEPVYVQGLADDVAHRHAGVERGVGVLEDYLHLAPVGQHVRLQLLLAVKDKLAVIRYPARRRLGQAQD